MIWALDIWIHQAICSCQGIDSCLLSFAHILNCPFCLQNIFQERIVQRREAEFSRLKKERDERTSQLISSRKRERDTVRKLMYYLNLEEQRLQRLREEEEARKREGKNSWLCALKYLFLSYLIRLD